MTTFWFCQRGPGLVILAEIALKSEYLLDMPAGSGTCHFVEIALKSNYLLALPAGSEPCDFDWNPFEK